MCHATNPSPWHAVTPGRRRPATGLLWHPTTPSATSVSCHLTTVPPLQPSHHTTTLPTPPHPSPGHCPPGALPLYPPLPPDSPAPQRGTHCCPRAPPRPAACPPVPTSRREMSMSTAKLVRWWHWQLTWLRLRKATSQPLADQPPAPPALRGTLSWHCSLTQRARGHPQHPQPARHPPQLETPTQGRQLAPANSAHGDPAHPRTPTGTLRVADHPWRHPQPAGHPPRLGTPTRGRPLEPSGIAQGYPPQQGHPLGDIHPEMPTHTLCLIPTPNTPGKGCHPRVLPHSHLYQGCHPTALSLYHPPGSGQLGTTLSLCHPPGSGQVGIPCPWCHPLKSGQP